MELHCPIKCVGRGDKGRTAAGSAAYRACAKIVDNNGEVHDFTNKKGHVFGGIMLPDGADPALHDPGELWRRHELKDIRKDAQLYRDMEFALPNELSDAACKRILEGVGRVLVEQGMCVQFDVHDNKETKTRARNRHCHAMITMRELLPDGTFGNKNRSWNRFEGGLNFADMIWPKVAELINIELERAGFEERVEHESFAERGVDRIPTTHVGVAATAMERKGKKTLKGGEKRYIEWLNDVHEKTLKKQSQTQAGAGNLAEHLEQANANGKGEEIYKGWDAVYAILRDNRRVRGAMRSELKKLDKFIAAYESGDMGWLRWAGCDLEDPAEERRIRKKREQLELEIRKADSMERLLKSGINLTKARNSVLYASRKASWDEYQILRNEKTIAYCDRRIASLNRYMEYLTRSIGLLDMIFNTAAYESYRAEMRELEQELKEVEQKRLDAREAQQDAKKALKEHKQDLRNAKKEERNVRKEERRNRRSGPDDR